VDGEVLPAHAKPFTGGKRARGSFFRFRWLVARGAQLREKPEIAAPAQNAKRVAALVALRGSSASSCARTSCFELQKSIGDSRWPHRSAPPAPKADRSQDRWRRERWPSPRRRTLRHPRNWHGRGSRGRSEIAWCESWRCRAVASRPQVSVRGTNAHEGDLSGRSRHGGHGTLSCVPVLLHESEGAGSRSRREMTPVDERHPRFGKPLRFTARRRNESWQLSPRRARAKARFVHRKLARESDTDVRGRRHRPHQGQHPR
jgi:hypothetical protein